MERMADLPLGSTPADALVDWVCARAAANRSVSHCDHCSHWEQPPLVRAGALPPPPRRARTAWFLCLTQPRDAISREHQQFARAAIVSARLNAPSVAPHVIYMSDSAAHPVRPDAFTGWLAAAGVRTIAHNLSFLHRIPTKRRRRGGAVPHLNVGAYCRIDVPRIVRRLAPELRARGLDDGSVLYTDTDVAFAADWDRPSRVHNFAAGTEVFSPSMNSGVMVLNVSGFGAEVDRMLDYAETKGFDFLTSDQALIQQWFAARTPDWRQRKVANRAAAPGWDEFADGLYNARAFWHPRRPRSGDALLEPRLWHWHGYKPSDVECWVRAIEGGSWPARGWNDIKPNCRQGRCRWKPIMGSGCRYFGRIAMTPCYLRTYTYLLTQHRRLLALADGVAGSEELLVDERIEMDKVRGKLKKLQAEVRAAEAAG